MSSFFMWLLNVFSFKFAINKVRFIHGIKQKRRSRIYLHHTLN